MSDNKRIKFLKDSIDNWDPIMLEIAHWYKQIKWHIKHKNIIRMAYLHHWISVWWYDDGTKEFLIYDSSMDQNSDWILNLRLKYDDLLFYRKWWVFWLKNYQFIKITKK